MGLPALPLLVVFALFVDRSFLANFSLTDLNAARLTHSIWQPSKVLSRLDKTLAAAVGDKDVVLDSYASDAGEIDARFDGDDHSRS